MKKKIGRRPVGEILEKIRERVLVFDGAMGSNLQTLGLTRDDFGGFEGCNEALNLFSPHSVREIHERFLKVGCRVVETNTFGATPISLEEFGLAERTAEINRSAARLAREAIENVPGDPDRFVAGSIGPTAVLPTLGQVSFEKLFRSYSEQVEGLWEGGCDILIVETCQDILQIKAALLAIRRLFEREGCRCPVMVSVTIQPSGTMLIGSDISAVQSVFEGYDFVDSIGFNCATGPLEMVRHVTTLTRSTGKLVSVMPNAGLPENVGGKAVYKLSPEEFAGFLKSFVEQDGVSIVGGCCGTTPDHLGAAVRAVEKARRGSRQVRTIPSAASVFHSAPLRQSPPPCLVGERTNSNGSRQFREFLTREDWEGMLGIARDQSRGGAHILDLCVAYAGRNEKKDLGTLAEKFARQIRLPLMIDSTDPEAVEAALKRHGGKCVINSVNLEDGGTKLRRTAAIARDFGAALVAMTIDEEGMAMTARRKVSVAGRMMDILSREFQFKPENVIFDPLTFTVCSGDPNLRTAARETLEAVSDISASFPESQTILGISNVSFGLNHQPREVLNSVFLSEATARGLTMAIVNPAGIIPPFRIPQGQKALATDLLLNPGPTGTELLRFIEAFEDHGQAQSGKAEGKGTLPPKERLREKILEGDSSGLEDLLRRLVGEVPPIEIINTILIRTMREVGELFGKGDMQLPFVLQSAEVVRAAMKHLEKEIPPDESTRGEKVVLATVSGDVHDIGKNLVNILLSNNGYQVIDLGIKVDIDTMVSAAREEGATVIGMSGLLVKSTQVMRENLLELNRRKFFPRVLLGGAALTREFVENDLRRDYKGEVFYAQDAFAGLSVLDSLFRKDGSTPARIKASTGEEEKANRSASKLKKATKGKGTKRPLPHPKSLFPWSGTKLLEPSLDEIIPFLEKRVLFEGRWEYSRGKRTVSQQNEFFKTELEPILEKLFLEIRKNNLLTPRGILGFFPCTRKGDRLEIRTPDSGLSRVFHFPRGKKEPHLCIADFFPFPEEGKIALWAATVGREASFHEKGLFDSNRLRDYLHFHGLSVELAEATAKWINSKVVKDLSTDLPVVRFSFGFPACPDLENQKHLLELLEAHRVGISLTDSFQMVPEQSTAGFLVIHPDARYFIP